MNRRGFLQLAVGFTLGLAANQREAVPMPTRPQIAPTPAIPDFKIAVSPSATFIEWGEEMVQGFAEGFGLNREISCHYNDDAGILIWRTDGEIITMGSQVHVDSRG